MKKRIFVAIKVSNDLKKEAKIFQEEVNDPNLKWLKKSDLHITMLAPWDEEDIKDAKVKLKNTKGMIKPFDINFNHITLGPYYDNPKLVWAKGKSSKELYEFKEILENIFQKHSDMRFKLHLTLARFERGKSRDVMNQWENKNISWTQKVESIVLIESILENSEIKYKVLEEVKI